MKKILLIFTLFICISGTASAQNYQSNGSYECQYKIDKYTTGSCIFLTDNNGRITGSFCGLNAPSAHELIANNKCSFTPNKTYNCKYQNGQCKVNITIKNGYEVSCQGTTPDTKAVYEHAKSGKCSINK